MNVLTFQLQQQFWKIEIQLFAYQNENPVPQGNLNNVSYNFWTNGTSIRNANTIKGKGFSFSENNNDWHHKILSKSQYDSAIKELGKN